MAQLDLFNENSNSQHQSAFRWYEFQFDGKRAGELLAVFELIEVDGSNAALEEIPIDVGNVSIGDLRDEISEESDLSDSGEDHARSAYLRDRSDVLGFERMPFDQLPSDPTGRSLDRMCRSKNYQDHSRCAEESQFRTDAQRYRQVSTARGKRLISLSMRSIVDWLGRVFLVITTSGLI